MTEPQTEPLTWVCPREDCIAQIVTSGDDPDLVQERHDGDVSAHRAAHRGQKVVPLELTEEDLALAAAIEAEAARIASS